MQTCCIKLPDMMQAPPNFKCYKRPCQCLHDRSLSTWKFIDKPSFSFLPLLWALTKGVVGNINSCLIQLLATSEQRCQARPLLPDLLSGCPLHPHLFHHHPQQQPQVYITTCFTHRHLFATHSWHHLLLTIQIPRAARPVHHANLKPLHILQRTLSPCRNTPTPTTLSSRPSTPNAFLPMYQKIMQRYIVHAKWPVFTIRSSALSTLPTTTASLSRHHVKPT